MRFIRKIYLNLYLPILFKMNLYKWQEAFTNISPGMGMIDQLV